MLLVPFEMATARRGAVGDALLHRDRRGARRPTRDLLTGLLRDDAGASTARSSSDYFAIAFLQTLHDVAATLGEAAALALAAGVDVELPTVAATVPRWPSAVRDGLVAEELVDRAAARVLRPEVRARPARSRLARPEAAPATEPTARSSTSTRPSTARWPGGWPRSRSCCWPTGTAPCRCPAARIAVIGPHADDPLALFGCYSFPRHVGGRHPERRGPPSATVLDALRAEFPGAQIDYARGCAVDEADRSGIADAAAHARAADVVVAVLGDQAGLFGRGTSGEGCDAADLRLPGVQGDLLRVVLATGTPVVLVLITGRPYAVGRWAGRWPRSCRRSSPARRAAARSPACCPGGSCPSGGCRSRCPRRPGLSRPRTCTRGWPPAPRQLRGPDAAVRLRPRAVVHQLRLVRPADVPPRSHRRTAAIALLPSATPATGTAPRWSSSTCTTRSPR